MQEPSLSQISIALYQFMCREKVGSENLIRLKRKLIAITDLNISDHGFNKITSGSFGEGLELKGSDVDYMVVTHLLKVFETTPMETPGLTLVTDKIDTRPGFTRIKVINNIEEYTFEKFNNTLYFSSDLFRKLMILQYTLVGYRELKLHGPCISRPDDDFDLAFCYHCPSWINVISTEQWLKRHCNEWPSANLKKRIIEHGVLLVPIGAKGSSQERLEWRISFSVAEKFLVNSFNHTQLVVYALLKIFLKDVILDNIAVKDLLCSYFIKTVVFWVSEELPGSEWRPSKLIPCFMHCFKRLVYFVSIGRLPHYFIPENNLLESKLNHGNKAVLLDRLLYLYNNGWKSILLSPQFSTFRDMHNCALLDVSDIQKIKTDFLFLIRSNLFINNFQIKTVDESKFQKLFEVKSQQLKRLVLLCASSQHIVRPITETTNKIIYYKYKQCHASSFLCRYHDAVSGWLQMAAVFYRNREYKTALTITEHVLTKCTPNMIVYSNKDSEIGHYFNLMSTVLSKGLISLFKYIFIGDILVKKDVVLIDELSFLDHRGPRLVPAVVFAHFLKFLCHFYLLNNMESKYALRALQNTVKNRYLISSSHGHVSSSLFVLSKAYEMIRDFHMAKKVFSHGQEILPL